MRESKLANKEVGILVEWNSPLNLTYGPSWHDALPVIIGSMKAATGGYMNRHGIGTNNSYYVLFYIPLMSSLVLDINPDLFLEFLIEPYCREKYQLSNITVKKIVDKVW